MLLFKSPATISVFLSFITGLTLITNAKAAPTYRYHFCSNTTTFSPNSTYQTNLDELLSVLPSFATRQNGYYNTTTGLNNLGNTVYGSFLCRGDVSTDTCRDCVSTATKQVLQKCPVEKESVIWYDECMLRYSNESFFSTVDESPAVYLWNTANISDPGRFKEVLNGAMSSAAREAANGGADKKFGTQETNFSSFQTLYTLAQCTPDLSVDDCDECLGEAIQNLPACCDGKQGGRVLMPSCNIRYEMYPFYILRVAPPPAPADHPMPKGNSGISAVKIIVIVVSIVLFLLLFCLACWFITRKGRKKYSSVPEESVEIPSVDYLQFDLETIRVATNNFSEDNKLGEGGFGEVYKGSLPNRQDIAVKRLSKSSRQGSDEFKNEVVLVAKLQHRNLVRLLGFCLDGEEKILIYEFMPNKSLDHFLFDSEKQQQLNWPRRYKIIEGIARGMLYLHEDSRLKIIHRDLKSSNILLDDDLNPKISDFGTAKIFGVDQTQGSTSRIVGTFGYMPPEYALHGHVSVKMDVYSFGVLVLEIISGKKNTSFRESGYAEDLLSYAWKKWKDGAALELLDTSMRNSYSTEEVTKCIHIGLCCVQEDPAQRPTMQTIVLMLNSDSYSVATPEQPAGYLDSKTQSSLPKMVVESDKSTTTSKSIPESIDEASITDVYPR